MSNYKKSYWCIGTVLFFIVCAASWGLFIRRQSAPEQDSIELMKIKVDATTRATPNRLAAPLEITNIYTYDALVYDRASHKYGTLSYELSKPAWIRIRIVSRRAQDLVLRTLVDWSKRDLGENTEHWDGRDTSGYCINREKCSCLFLIEGDSVEHAAHDQNKCSDMSLQITCPQPGEVVDGQSLFRIAFTSTKRGYSAGASCVLRVYVDYELSNECYIPAQAEPFKWMWDTRSVSNGYHLITVNFDDGHDHIGSASVNVEVRN